MRSLIVVLVGFALAPLARAGGLECQPAVVTPATPEIRLVFERGAGREVAVVAPSGAFYYLAGPEVPGKSPLEPFVAGARVIVLDPRRLEGWRFAADAGWEHVFVAPGVYEFRSADVLQTDADRAGDPLRSCRVEFEVAAE